MEANILKQIFFDHRGHWDAFVTKYGKRIRPNVIKEVNKFRNCGNPKNGFKLFVCEGCHDLRPVLYRCKGRFCTTCSCAIPLQANAVFAGGVPFLGERRCA